METVGGKNRNDDNSSGDGYNYGGLFSPAVQRRCLYTGQEIFSSAPKENLATIPERKERFRGAHAIGWVLVVIALLMFVGALALGIWDGVKNGFAFPAFFVRFLIMLYGMEVYDIILFDWVLLCHFNFFPHFYPELKGIVGPQQFGYNKKTHIVHFIISLPICAILAWVCTIF